MEEKTATRIFVNTPMEPDLVSKLDAMVEMKESSRAQFIRLLIRQEWDEFSQDQKASKTRTSGR